MAPTRRTPFALLALAVAALLSAWNPASAPIGLAVGLLGAALCLKARREEGAFSLTLRVALAVSVVAIVLSIAIIARAAWAGRARHGEPIVEEVPRAERAEALRRAADATRPSRDAARRELEAVEPKR